MTFDEKAIRRAVGRAAATQIDDQRIVRDIEFHLTDWLDDLERFHAFCKDPTALTAEEACEFLIQFLIHVPNHVAAAAKLLADSPVTDIFEVGAVGEDDEQ
ncbi:MAG: hypothetical protein V3T70_04455 [Phycisphaerae bacterium]